MDDVDRELADALEEGVPLDAIMPVVFLFVMLTNGGKVEAALVESGRRLGRALAAVDRG